MIDNFIRELELKGWKQREIAEKTGLSRNFISHLLHGKNCSLETVIRFADAFGVSTDTVLGRAEGQTMTPEEKMLLDTTDGDRELARVALRSALGEKSLKSMKGEGMLGEKRLAG